MTLLHPAPDSEVDATRASTGPSARGGGALRGDSAGDAVSARAIDLQPAALTRREARALERAAAEAALRPVEAPAPRRTVPTGSAAANRSADANHSAVPTRSAAATRSVSSAADRPGSARSLAASQAAARSKAAQRTKRLSVVGAMLFVGATIVSTSVPANAYFVDTPQHVAVKLAVAAESGTTVGGASARGQNFVVSNAGGSEDLGRDGYSVTSKVSGVSNAQGATFTNNSSAAVQWPFPIAVPISSGFGARKVANCSFCSTFHEGLDFTPGAGTPIQIIADGTVSKVDQGSGALGYNVWIEHVIGGQKVTSVYAHMIAGSIRVTQGEQVKVGQIVGLVGSTGNSTGAHLHFEIHLDGIPVDPYPWLVANAGRA